MNDCSAVEGSVWFNDLEGCFGATLELLLVKEDLIFFYFEKI
jgi:hypothetical protein